MFKQAVEKRDERSLGKEKSGKKAEFINRR